MAKNAVEKGKSRLTILAIGAIILGLVGMIGGIMLLTSSLKGDDVVKTIIISVLGGILALGGVAVLAYAVYWLIISRALKATKGSLKMDNVAMAGTVNMNKCPNCGVEINDTMKRCPNCGQYLSDTKVCKECGTTNIASAKMCTNCGKPLDD